MITGPIKKTADAPSGPDVNRAEWLTRYIHLATGPNHFTDLERDKIRLAVQKQDGPWNIPDNTIAVRKISDDAILVFDKLGKRTRLNYRFPDEPPQISHDR